MNGVSNNHAVVRLIISLLDGYLRYYPMQDFYEDSTTYLKGVNTYWSVSALEQYRNKIKNLRKTYKEIEFQAWICIQILLLIKLPILKHLHCGTSWYTLFWIT